MRLLPLTLATTLLAGAAAAQPYYWHDGPYRHWHGGPWRPYPVLPPAVVFAPPPVYVVPAPVVVAPRIVVRRPVVAPVAVFDPGPLLGAAVAPPVIVLPPPAVVAEAAPPPVIPTPPADALPITPPAVADATIPPAWRVGGFITAAYVTRPPVVRTVVRRVVRYVPAPYVVVAPPLYPLPPPYWHRPWHPHGWERGWRY